MRFIKTKTFGIYIYDMPIKATNEDSEIICNTYIEEVLIHFPRVIERFGDLKNYILNKKYWGDFEVTQALFKYVNNYTRSKLIKPNAVISVPVDGIVGPFGDIFKRAISEAVISSGWRSAKLVENVLCAAIGTGVHVKEQNKSLFIYSNNWCTYFCIIFDGIIVNLDIIQNPIEMIGLSEVISTLDALKTNTLPRLPLYLFNTERVINNRDNMDLNWSKPIEDRVYIAIPDKKRIEYSAWLGKYQAFYTKNYETCIINGLAQITKDTDLIL